MSSGGVVDRIAAEFGVHFVAHHRAVAGPHQSRCRRTCQRILKSHGPEHLRQVLGLINSDMNRGRWDRAIVKGVSGFVRRRTDLHNHPDLVAVFDELDLAELKNAAERVNQGRATTVTMEHLIGYEVDRRLKEREAA